MVGFDAAVRAVNLVLWQILGYTAPLAGVLFPSIVWPFPFGLHIPKNAFPNVQFNLFLQVKRPIYYERMPRTLKGLVGIRSPLWAFKITNHQQKLLETLATATKGAAHVAYASAAFHTYDDLHLHMRQGTLVESSTFPSALSLIGHDAWYYWSPGSAGAANPNPEFIEEPPLLDRIRAQARGSESYERGDLSWLARTAHGIIEAVHTAVGPWEAVGSYFLEELRTLDRLADQYELEPNLRAFCQIALFVTRFDLKWLVVTGEG